MQLIRGDCLEKMKDLESGSVDMVLTDPPYGMDFQSNHRKMHDRRRLQEPQSRIHRHRA